MFQRTLVKQHIILDTVGHLSQPSGSFEQAMQLDL